MQSQERAALALWLLQQAPMTTAEMAERLEMSWNGARALLIKISRTTPIYRDDESHTWRVLREGTEGEQA